MNILITIVIVIALLWLIASAGIFCALLSDEHRFAFSWHWKYNVTMSAIGPPLMVSYFLRKKSGIARFLLRVIESIDIEGMKR